jgi:carboxymethylenebutenolidase
MPRLTAQDFHPEVLRLFDQYVHGLLSRRGFLGAAAQYGGGAIGAELLLAQLAPNFAMAQQVKDGDARISTSRIDIPSPQGYGHIQGYLARPAQAAAANAVVKLPVVLVVHENRGLNPHIEDIARRLALEGFIALAPDALTTLGGYPGDEDKARERFTQLDQAKVRADFLAAAAHLQALPQGTGRLGVVGFCFGGGMVNFLATRLPELAAAVPFYGPAPAAEEVARIKAPLLLHYAGTDERINAGWPAYEKALQAAGVRYEAHVYAGTQHGFNNDTTPRYDEAAAKLAWQRTLSFFTAKLKA